MPAVHIVSFADGLFSERGEKFASEAEAMDLYDSITVHDFLSLPDKFVAEHGQFIKNNARGFGYWLWKPAIILDHLYKMTKNEVLVYADAGFTQNPRGRERMMEYVQIAAASPFGMLSFMHPYVEYFWTKKDLAMRLGVAENPRIMSTSQLYGGLIVMIRNAHTIAVMEEWFELSVEDNYHFLTDDPSKVPNDTRFCEHRHDQSIGSLVRKLRGTEVTFCETEIFHYAQKMHGDSWPMLATRTKS